MEKVDYGRKQTKIRREIHKIKLDRILVWINISKWTSIILSVISISLIMSQRPTPHALYFGGPISALLILVIAAMILSLIATLALFIIWRNLAGRYKASTTD